MPSFDIVSKVDAQALDNAVNVTTKEITNRFDFKGSHVVINLDKKDFVLKLETEDDMKMRQLVEMLINRANKQGISPHAFDLSKDPYQSGKTVKQEITVKNGLKQEDAKSRNGVNLGPRVSKAIPFNTTLNLHPTLPSQ